MPTFSPTFLNPIEKLVILDLNHSVVVKAIEPVLCFRMFVAKLQIRV